jgi:CDP-glucose 4,6-dehydratase
LAATSIVGQAVKAPLKAFSDNIRGTWNVLEASRQSPSVEGLIVASSDKAYGSHNKLPYTESSALCGEHPYDASKSCADILARAYFVTYGAPVCVTRCGNIFGPGDFNFSRIIPDAIRSILKGKTLVIRSDGKFVRDYIYIKDIISGYLALAEKMLGRRIRGEAFNFSNESPLSVLAAVKLIARLCGRRPDYKITDLAKHEIKYQYLCADKARKMLGWSPAYKLEDGLRETIAWYRDYLAGRY